jgi:DNA-directed RNA polymerase specialized sigma24 family protein
MPDDPDIKADDDLEEWTQEAEDENLERWIQEAKAGDEKSLKRVVRSRWFNELTAKQADRAARDYHVDADRVRNYVLERTLCKIHTLNNDDNVIWVRCLGAWSRQIANRRASNLLRGWRAQERLGEWASDENNMPPEGGGYQILLPSRPPTQMEEIERKEREAFDPKLRRIVRDLCAGLAPVDALIVKQWIRGHDPGDIFELTGIPLSTVYKRLKAFQKALINEVSKARAEEIGEEEVKKLGLTRLVEEKVYREGIRELVANSLGIAAGSP